MSTDANAVLCRGYTHELTRIATGEMPLASASAELREHIAACTACTEVLRDDAGMYEVLQAALRPEPLGAALEAQILRLIAARQPAAPRTYRLFWRAPLAAAAGIAALLLWHVPSLRPLSGGDDSAVATQLSVDEAGDIAAALGRVMWADVHALALDEASAELSEIQATLEPASDDEALLPWTAADDWDMPDGPARSSAAGSIVRDFETLRAKGQSPRANPFDRSPRA